MNIAPSLRLSVAALAFIAAVNCSRASNCCCRGTNSTTASEASLYQNGLQFRDDRGRAVSLSDLKGHPVVIAMFFASCGSACPALVGELQAMERSLPPALLSQTRFVLVSFDSERDQPSVLGAYRNSHHLDDRWILLQGDERTVRRISVLLGVNYRREQGGYFSHTTVATVLDRDGVVLAARSGLGGSLNTLEAALAKAASPLPPDPAS